MNCPVCSKEVEEFVDYNEETSGLLVCEDYGYDLEAYSEYVTAYKCANDHTFFMESEEDQQDRINGHNIDLEIPVIMLDELVSKDKTATDFEAMARELKDMLAGFGIDEIMFTPGDEEK